MGKLIVAKFGGSAIGVDGEGIPHIIKRINDIKKDSKVMAVCSAPLTAVNGKRSSLTDVILNLGNDAANGADINIEIIAKTYSKILSLVSDKHKVQCQHIIDEMLLMLSLIHI